MSNVNIHIKFQSRDAVSLGGRKELCFRYLVVVDQSLSHIWLFVTSWTAALQVSLPFTISLSLLKLCQWCHPTISFSVTPSPPALNLSQPHGLFNESALRIRWPTIGTSTSVLSMNILDLFPLGLTGLISLLNKGLSRVFSSTTVRRHQFFGAQPSLWFNSHTHKWLLEKP